MSIKNVNTLTYNIAKEASQRVTTLVSTKHIATANNNVVQLRFTLVSLR